MFTNKLQKRPAFRCLQFFLSVGIYFACAHLAFGKTPGSYYGGNLILKDLGDGRNKEVVEAFGFIDSEGFKWDVPTGAKTNGASIPRALWVFGSPYTGLYVKAAVIHDHYYDTKYRSWARTHDVFYEAMLASGVPKWKANTMWATVYRFGSRWTKAESTCWTSCAGGMLFWENVDIIPDFAPRELKKIKQFISNNPAASKEEIQKFIDENTFTYKTGETYSDGSPAMKHYGARVRGYVSQSIGDETARGGNPGYAFGGIERRFADGKAPDWRWPTLGNENESVKYPTYLVTNISSDDMLNIRNGPRPTAPLIDKIPHDARGISILGRCKKIWCRIRYKGVEGWVNTKFLAFDLGAR